MRGVRPVSAVLATALALAACGEVLGVGLYDPSGAYAGTLSIFTGVGHSGRPVPEVSLRQQEGHVRITSLGRDSYRVELPDGCRFTTTYSARRERSATIGRLEAGQRCRCGVDGRTFVGRLYTDGYAEIIDNQLDVEISSNLEDGAEGYCRWEFHGARSR